MLYLVCNEIGTPFFHQLVTAIEHAQSQDMDELSDEYVLESSHILNLSTYYYMKGDVKKSIEILNWRSSRGVNLDILVIQKCKILILEGRYDEAMDSLDNLWNQMNPNALFERFKLCILHNDNENAKYYVDLILEKIKSKEQLFTQLAFFFIKNHDLKRAGECWEAACKNPPKTDDFIFTQIAYDYERGELQRAYNRCSSLYKKHPNNMYVCFYLTALCISLKMIKKSKAIICHLKIIAPSNVITLKLEKVFEEKRCTEWQHK